jgi:hypothetical protein
MGGVGSERKSNATTTCPRAGAGKSWNEVLRDGAWTFVAIAAFPELAHRLRWPTRLGPRGLLLYIAFNTALGFTVRGWVTPRLKRLGERNEQAEQELRPTCA